MAAVGSLQLSLPGIYKSRLCREQFQKPSITLSSSYAMPGKSCNPHLSYRLRRQIYSVPYSCSRFRCNSSLNPGHSFDASSIKTAALTLARACINLRGSIFAHRLVPAVGVLLFAFWGLCPLMRQSRKIFLHKNDNSWQKSSTYHFMISYLQPVLLCTGALLICRALDPIVLPTEPSQIVKQRLLNFVRSLSTVLAFAYCISSVIQQTQKFFMETSDPNDARYMGFQFAGKALYTAVWVAAASLFMELLGFSTQKWLTAGGLGTVLLTLAGREIFTNFLSSAMIHATRPFVVNEWIQTKIEGYEVSGTVEHVGWWSPTVVRGEDREAVHIPNHKFTVNVVRNLTQKTHWRVKTHLAISHLDVNKINIIVADMRKVLAKNPQVEHKKLHRRVFLDNVNPENQALLILISCFVKTSHFEEYLCVKEAILLDLLRVIRHHRARLATPIRTVQKIYTDADMEDMPYADSMFNSGTAPNRPLLLIEPSYKINGEERTKSSARSTRVNGAEDVKATTRSTADSKTDSRGGTAQSSDSKAKESPASKEKEVSTSETSADGKAKDAKNAESKEGSKVEAKPSSDIKLNDKATGDSISTPDSKSDSKAVQSPSPDPEVVAEDSSLKNTTKQPSKAIQESRPVNTAGNSSTTLPDAGGEKSGKQLKQQRDRPSATSPPSTKPAIEENIVLGVALDGSKRTLPIEEVVASTTSNSDTKEPAARSSGNSPSVSSDNGKKDGPKSDG